MGGHSKFVDLLLNIFSFSKYFLFVLVIGIAFAVLFGLPLLVKGESMMPNFLTGEVVVVEKISYMNNKSIKRGDVVAARFPVDPDKTRIIKRVIGLPGDVVEVSGSYIFINGEQLDESSYAPNYGPPPYEEISYVKLQTDEYFLCGDNRPDSSDSRLWGPVFKEDILGRAAFTIWPVSRLRYIPRSL